MFYLFVPTGCPLTSDQSDQSGVEASTPGQSQANMNTNNGSMNTSSCHVSGRTKRMRTSFKHHQLRTMKQYFAINQNPDAKDLKQLAQKTSLSKRVLQVRVDARLDTFACRGASRWHVPGCPLVWYTRRVRDKWPEAVNLPFNGMVVN